MQTYSIRAPARSLTTLALALAGLCMAAMLNVNAVNAAALTALTLSMAAMHKPASASASVVSERAGARIE